MARTRAAYVLPIAVAALSAGCSAQTNDAGGQTATSNPVETSSAPAPATPTPGTSVPGAGTSSAVAPSSSTPSASAQASGRPLVCSKPSRDLLKRVAADIDQHPGPVTAASMVRAADTQTGTWYVVAVERARVSDHDGSRIPGRTTGVGLTNIPSYREVPALIPLGQSTTGAPTLSWDHVSWTGDRLQQGKLAAATALACIGH